MHKATMKADNAKRQESDDYSLEGNWEHFWNDGEKYLKTAKGAFAGKKFNNEILYNLFSMAMEKFYMAALMSKGKMPANHTMFDLIQELDIEETQKLLFTEKMKYVDTFQQICSLDHYERKKNEEYDMDKIQEIALDVKELTFQYMQ